MFKVKRITDIKTIINITMNVILCCPYVLYYVRKLTNNPLFRVKKPKQPSSTALWRFFYFVLVNQFTGGGKKLKDQAICIRCDEHCPMLAIKSLLAAFGWFPEII
jgi:hypothetical protein